MKELACVCLVLNGAFDRNVSCGVFFTCPWMGCLRWRSCDVQVPSGKTPELSGVLLAWSRSECSLACFPSAAKSQAFVISALLSQCYKCNIVIIITNNDNNR